MSYRAGYLGMEPARADIDSRAGVTVLEFGAPWCPHCIAAQPALEEWLASLPGADHVKVEDGSGRPLGRSFRIKLWPTLVVLRDGQEIARVVRPRTSADLEPLRTALEDGPDL